MELRLRVPVRVCYADEKFSIQVANFDLLLEQLCEQVPTLSLKTIAGENWILNNEHTYINADSPENMDGYVDEIDRAVFSFANNAVIVKLYCNFVRLLEHDTVINVPCLRFE